MTLAPSRALGRFVTSNLLVTASQRRYPIKQFHREESARSRKHASEIRCAGFGSLVGNANRAKAGNSESLLGVPVVSGHSPYW